MHNNPEPYPLTFSTLSAVVIWQPTPELRWARRNILVAKDIRFVEERVAVLQQKWFSSTGTIKWKDVPIVEETKP